jgi:hypothetical protein
MLDHRLEGGLTMQQRMASAVTQWGIIVIPPWQRLPYGNDVAATGRVGRTRASVCGRVGHFPERPPGRSAARVSGPEEACSTRGAIASASAGDSAASQSRTRAPTQVRPRRVAGSRCESNGSCRCVASPPDETGQRRDQIRVSRRAPVAPKNCGTHPAGGNFASQHLTALSL